VGDLSGPHGLSVLLLRSKADREGEGVHVAANPLAAHCPVAALRAWLAAAGITEDWSCAAISPAATEEAFTSGALWTRKDA
jgi:hypothetical protein